MKSNSSNPSISNSNDCKLSSSEFSALESIPRMESTKSWPLIPSSLLEQINSQRFLKDLNRSVSPFSSSSLFRSSS
ncbi:hypothetical protein WICPIJ_009919 [Wickerhamomyces pijperi]|uniref:Uncharacterized protein n=1 Tax=Wickerhamomyces pijperi TaxID=599730 RepID=A0A9P8PIP7_WICPI|nr:hypothetical protein WICPIJ_009919 [Wickerhamomyces pijperi]